MATTGFWPVRGKLKKVLDYADNPDKTTAKEYLDEDLYQALRYTENDNKTDERKYVSGVNCSAAFAYEETFGNLKSVTDAKSHAVTYGYDAKGRGTSVTFADGSASTLEYDDLGDVVKSTNRRGQVCRSGDHENQVSVLNPAEFPRLRT